MHQFNDERIYHVRLPSNLHANSMKMKGLIYIYITVWAFVQKHTAESVF